MEWHSPLYFWMLLLLPVVAGLFAWAWRQRQRLYAHFPLLEATSVHNAQRRRLIQAVAVSCTIAALIVGLARPRVGGAEREVEQRGLDLIVALDLSHSMLAADVAPTRLDRARNELRRLLDQLAGDRVALVVFAGTGMVHAPLTTDYPAVSTLLDIVDPPDMPHPGTNLDGAMQAAVHALDPDPSPDPDALPRAQALLILSDGEFHDAAIGDARSQAEAHNLTIFTVGVGTRDGARVPAFNDDGDPDGWRTDPATGDPVRSHLDPTSLEALVTEPGQYYELGAVEGSLDPLLNDLRNLERSPIGIERFESYTEWFTVPLGLALALLLLDHLLPVRSQSVLSASSSLTDA